MKKVIARIILAWGCLIPLMGLTIIRDEYHWVGRLIGDGLAPIAIALLLWPVIELIWWAYKVVFKPES